MKKQKIYIVGGDLSYFKFIDNNKFEICKNIENSNILLFTGGEDVSPELYNHKNLTSYVNKQRDKFENEIYQTYGKNKNCIGICRGSQFLCTMNGGTLIQDMRHPSIHYISVTDGESEFYKIKSSSTHHQMQNPYNLPKEKYKILGFTNLDVKENMVYDGNLCDNINNNPEIVLYYKDNNLKDIAIQGHPEYKWSPVEFTEYCKNLVNKFLA